ncbi:hypothetical protein HNR46_001600 [Haloferula luteola]|uniref:Uncharacterized protein n=2 Tax=Haloferula luteola TaxID=595692 RepID=A0A840V6Y4_9BACT|nr:hypothetical protein [Haloferula luteola]MBB5351364.1 hypothetical protein [Haloferula luteola]
MAPALSTGLAAARLPAITPPAGVHAFGGQMELGGVSSYIPTGAAAATRQQDVMSLSDMDWFDPSAGVILAEVGAYPGSLTGQARQIIALGSGNDRIILRAADTGPGYPHAYVGNGTSLSGPTNAGTTTVSAREYVALSFSTAGGSYLHRRIGDGAAASSANIGNFSGTTPASMSIGSNLDGHLRNLAFLPGLYTPSEVRALLDSMP